MEYELNLLPTYSEDATVMTLVVQTPDKQPISKRGLIEILREYADILEGGTDEFEN